MSVILQNKQEKRQKPTHTQAEGLVKHEACFYCKTLDGFLRVV